MIHNSCFFDSSSTAGLKQHAYLYVIRDGEPELGLLAVDDYSDGYLLIEVDFFSWHNQNKREKERTGKIERDRKMESSVDSEAVR
jgi:hypothetical protein